MMLWPAIIYVLDACFSFARREPEVAVLIAVLAPPLVVALPALFFGADAYLWIALLAFFAWGIALAWKFTL